MGYISSQLPSATTQQQSVQIAQIANTDLAFGNTHTVQTPKGTLLSDVLGPPPVPRLRQLPLERRPPLPGAVLGRDAELAWLASVSPDSPVEVYGPSGVGKTWLLKQAAYTLVPPSEGTVFESVRRKTLDQILSMLYDACFEPDLRWAPTPQQVSDYLVGRSVLVVLDDCEMDRDDVDVLLDKLPSARLVIGSPSRTLWSRGAAREMQGLSEDAAMAVLEGVCGGLTDADRDDALRLVRRLNGSPQRLSDAAIQIRDGQRSLHELSAGDGADRPGSDSQQHLTRMLAKLRGASIGTGIVRALVSVADQELAEYQERSLVKTSSPSLRLSELAPDFEPMPEIDELAEALHEYLTSFCVGQPAAAVAAEADAIVATLQLFADHEHWSEVLTLARAAELKLASTGGWVAWQQVLQQGLVAARALGDEDGEAHMLHQLGSLSGCLDEHDEAIRQLDEALTIRTARGDALGMKVTGHNLRHLEGPASPTDSGARPAPVAPAGRTSRSYLFGSRPSALGLWSGLLLLALVAGVAALVFSGRGERATDLTPPAIVIASPSDGAVLSRGGAVRAEFSCRDDRDGSGVRLCVGEAVSASSAVRVRPGDTIDTSRRGDYVLGVVAVDAAGNRSIASVLFAVR